MDIGPVLLGRALEGEVGEGGLLGRADVHAEGVPGLGRHDPDDVLAPGRDVALRVAVDPEDRLRGRAEPRPVENKL